MTWWIATVAPSLEARARAELEHAGVSTWLPLRTVPIHNARIDDMVRRGKLAQPYRTYAAFPGYMLVQVEGEDGDFWHAVRACRHIRGIITNHGRAMHFTDDEMAISARRMTCELRDTSADAWPLGDTVAITEGAFAGFNGTVSRGLRKGSVQILVSLLGALQRVDVPQRSLAKVA